MDRSQFAASLSSDGPAWARFVRGAVCLLGFLLAGGIIRIAVRRSLRMLGVDRSAILLLGQIGFYLMLVLGLLAARIS